MAIVFDCDFVNIGMGDTLSSRIEKFKFKVDRVKINNKGINFQHSHNREPEIRKYISEIRDAGRKLNDIIWWLQKLGKDAQVDINTLVDAYE